MSATGETASEQAWPETAIERQIAAAYGKQNRSQQNQQAARPNNNGSGNNGRFILDYNTERPKPRRFGLIILLTLLLLGAAGLVFVFTDSGRPLQKSIGEIPAVAGPVVRDRDSLPTTTSIPSSTTISSAASSSSSTNNSSATKASAILDTKSLPANADEKAEPKSTAQVSTAQSSTANALSIPLADVSLRDRPELLEQLVQIYQTQLASGPNNATARAALDQLQERSLSELQTIIVDGDEEAASKALGVVSRLFPEAVNSTQFKYLAARVDHMRRLTKENPKSEPSKSAAGTAAAVSPAANSSSVAAKKSDAAAVPSKPEIRSVSITPGKMIDDRFVPSDGGNVFMVEISYSNFAKAFIEQTEATLVTRLGVPGDSMVMGEVPVVISADRGTKSFIMETMVSGNVGGKFQLNFMLNDEFLTSRTVRLSMAGQ